MNYQLGKLSQPELCLPLLSLPFKSLCFSPHTVFLLTAFPLKRRQGRTPLARLCCIFWKPTSFHRLPEKFSWTETFLEALNTPHVLIDLAIYPGLMDSSLQFICSFSIVKLIPTPNLAVTGNGTLSFLHHVLSTLENPTHWRELCKSFRTVAQKVCIQLSELCPNSLSLLMFYKHKILVKLISFFTKMQLKRSMWGMFWICMIK